jgi:hypothetical protein
MEHTSMMKFCFLFLVAALLSVCALSGGEGRTSPPGARVNGVAVAAVGYCASWDAEV